MLHSNLIGAPPAYNVSSVLNNMFYVDTLGLINHFKFSQFSGDYNDLINKPTLVNGTNGTNGLNGLNGQNGRI